MKKTIIGSAIVLLAVGAAGSVGYHALMGQAEQASAEEMPPAEVKVQAVKAENVEITQELPGRTQAFRVAEIRPQVSGIVTKRLFEEGSDVKEGQQLYQIDPTLYQASYDSALADLQKAEANVKPLQIKQDRYAKLIKMGGISKQDFDDNAAALAQGLAQISMAKAAVATAKANLDYTKVFSPISGRIGKSSVTEGALVTANQGEALALVQQLDKIYVDVTQSVGDLRKMQRLFDGQQAPPPVSLTVEGESEPYPEKGVLQFTDVTVDQGTGTVQLRILFDNPKAELLPGMFVRARLSQTAKDASVLVPQKAVTRGANNAASVWVLDKENKASARKIDLGQNVGDRWVVLSGLSEGEKIVVEGGQKIAPDAPVKPVE